MEFLVTGLIGLILAALWILWCVAILICAYTTQKWVVLTCEELRKIREAIDWRTTNDAAAADK